MTDLEESILLTPMEANALLALAQTPFEILEIQPGWTVRIIRENLTPSPPLKSELGWVWLS
jgi:hypothetical protein